MVRRVVSLILFVIFTATLIAESLTPKTLFDYKVGETATEDIIAPEPLLVIDRHATEMLRQQEAQRIPVIFLFNPHAASEAEDSFRTALAALRETFLDAMEAVFHSRKLDDQAMDSPQFQEFANSFLAASNSFPADAKILVRWATGKSDDAVANAVALKLRSMMEYYIRPEGLPVEVKPDSRVRIFTVADRSETLLLEEVERQSTEMSLRDIATLVKARSDFEKIFLPGEETIASFAAGYLKENCIPDAELTSLSRAKATDSILSADSYKAGQFIVRRGEVITPKTKAALNQLAEKVNASQVASDAVSRIRKEIVSVYNRGLLVALVAVLMLSGFTIWRLAARRLAVALPQLPARIVGLEHNGMVITCPTCAEHIAVPFGNGGNDKLPADQHHCTDSELWRQRALLAEHRAEQTTAIVRMGLISQLSHFFTTELLKKLVSQRDDLLQAQQQAAEQVDSAALQLLKTVGNWQNLRQLYENRIARLEKDLEMKDEENQALIRAKIAIARRQLQAVNKQAGVN